MDAGVGRQLRSWGRGWYFEKLAVDPKNADIVYVPNVAVSRTKDGGKTWVALRGSPGGDDYHQAWISPDDPNTMIVASDQGAIITRNAKTPTMQAMSPGVRGSISRRRRSTTCRSTTASRTG